VTHLLHAVSSSPASYGLVFLVVCVDALLPFVQAEAVVISAAVLAAQGDLQIWLLVPIVALAGFAGDNLCYLVGSKLGCRVTAALSRREKQRRRIEQARKGVRERGSLIVVVARFLPVGRTLTTFAAGTLEMPWRRFLVADAIAATAWAVYACLLGYVGGASFEHSLWKPLALSLGIAALLGLLTEAYRRIQKKRGREVLAGELR
jgi:membrane protein DedA with SNARE-associated domain